jgi:hypothetical protein
MCYLQLRPVAESLYHHTELSYIASQYVALITLLFRQINYTIILPIDNATKLKNEGENT